MAGAGRPRRRLATAAAVLAVALPLSASCPVALVVPRRPEREPAAVRRRPRARRHSGRGDTVCGDVRFDRAKLPGRTGPPSTATGPPRRPRTCCGLHGWPRAVPFDVAHWTVVTDGTAGVLVASLPGSGFRYLPIHRAVDGSWSVGPPCTPR